MTAAAVDRAAVERQLAAARAELEARVKAGRPDTADDLKDTFPDVWADPEAALELVYAEFVFRTAGGDTPDPADYYRRYPHWGDRLERLFALYDLLRGRETQGGRADGTVGDDGEPAEPPPPGRHPPGYEILGEIGRGGMAVVYRARQVALNRVVAVKVLRGGWLGDEDRCRVRREATAAARLQHPHVVQIHEVGEWDGVPFLTLEHVPGGTLADVLARSPRQGAVGVTPRRAAELVETLARAMHAAHEAGIVHRDLKPANILLAGDPADPLAGPKIADFGLAVTVDRPAAESHTGTLAGTPCYMAPEQADGRRAAVGPRTDVYALGGVLYELLAGRPPVQGATVLETLDLVRTADPVAPRLLSPNTPRDLETVCLKCLRKSPDQRYPSAAALADDLRRHLDGRPITARPVSTFEYGVMWAKRHPLVAGLAAAVVLLVGTVLAVTTGKWRASEAAREREAGLRQELEATRSHELIASARAHWNNNEVDEAKRLLALVPDEHRTAGWHTLRKRAAAEVGSVPLPVSGFLRVSPSGRLAVVVSPWAQQSLLLDTATSAVLGKLPYSDYQTHQYFFPTDDETRLYSATHTVGRELRATYPGVAEPAARLLDLNAFRTQPNLGPQPTRYSKSSSRGVLALLNEARTRIKIREGGDLSRKVIAEFDLTAHGRCTGFALDATDRHLATAHPKAVVVWDIRTRAKVAEYPFHSVPTAFDYAVHPDLDTLYWRQPVADAEMNQGQVNAVVAWDLAAGRERFRVAGDYTSWTCRLSPDGSLLAVGNYLVIHLYDARTGRLVTSLRGHKSGNPSFDFFPDGKRMLTLSTDKLLKTWDLSAWRD